MIAKRGIRTGVDFADFMTGLMSDVISGQVAPQVANAAVHAGGKLLKVVEMQYRYAAPDWNGNPHEQIFRQPLVLAGPRALVEDRQVLKH